MCTGAEPAAAGAAKGTTGLAATGAAGGVAGGTGLTLGAGGATGLTAGAAGAAGFSPALASAGFTAGQAAGAGLASGIGSALSKVTTSNVTAGASAVNAGTGLLSAIKGQKTPPAPSLLAPITMPTPDDLATRRARAAMISKLSQRRGRSSTILSNDTLGN